MQHVFSNGFELSIYTTTNRYRRTKSFADSIGYQNQKQSSKTLVSVIGRL